MIGRASSQGFQYGIVLPVALILLAAMTLTALASFRGVLSADIFSNNVRTQNVALQSAEQALRFCESQLSAAAPQVVAQALPAGADAPSLWKSIGAWEGSAAKATTVDTTLPGEHPQCLIEELLVQRTRGEPVNAAYLVTARGFGPDYRRGAGNAVAGAQVWVQSVVRQ